MNIIGAFLSIVAYILLSFMSLVIDLAFNAIALFIIFGGAWCIWQLFKFILKQIKRLFNLIRNKFNRL